ncbi:SDR family oxidoreductase [Desulfohalobiaceae bacterium Ax17]|uniref:oxidoreductase n=1 Tax=Desulfovulcanus ferrireducens TaxID=2831190 RepID=UPI00207B9B18|nr:SDR family oxidoreductase [Desulfovulcanus ferrireducens]
MLKDKIVVISGGAGLIGKEFIKTVIVENGIGIIADNDSEAGKAAFLEIKNYFNSDKVEFVQMDITNKKSIDTIINFLHEKYGKIDALVNSAYPRNIHYGKIFEEVEYKDFCENINLHLGGYFLTSQQFALYFKNQGYGNIINIASIYGVVPPRFEIYEGTNMTMPVEYACIKSAIIHLTKYMAKYFKNNNIRVNCISPGGIFDNQPDIFVKKYNQYGLSKGLLNCEDLKGSLIYLLSDMSRYVNGQNIIIDDGWTL